MNFSSATVRLVVAVVAAGGASALCQQTIPANASLLAGGLNGPRGLAFGSDGSLYVAEAGTGGTVPPPVGPYLGGSNARISKIDPSGNRTTVASGLPSSVDALGDLAGVADLTFIGNGLYALVAGGGCSHGNPVYPNGIVRVDTRSGAWSYLTDLSLFYPEHPVAFPTAPDCEALEFSAQAGSPALGQGKVVRLTAEGRIEDVVSGLSVPTGMTFGPDHALYISNYGAAPAGAGQILRIANP